MAAVKFPTAALLPSYRSYLLFLFTAFPVHSLAQSSATSATPTASPSALPTDPDFGDDGSHRLLNYFFLLLLALVAATVAAYFLVLRRRQQKVARLQGNRQDALAQDLEGWSAGRRWGHGRWRSESRVEGLNERGEAPPPYMPERPAETHPPSGSRNEDGAIPLQDRQKPPEYEERLAYPPGDQRLRPASRFG